jgi:hypothetical protein
VGVVIMKSNSNFRMNKLLKITLIGMGKCDRKTDYRKAMIAAIVTPKIDFKKRKETSDE